MRYPGTCTPTFSPTPLRPARPPPAPTIRREPPDDTWTVDQFSRNSPSLVDASEFDFKIWRVPSELQSNLPSIHSVLSRSKLIDNSATPRFVSTHFSVDSAEYLPKDILSSNDNLRIVNEWEFASVIPLLDNLHRNCRTAIEPSAARDEVGNAGARYHPVALVAKFKSHRSCRFSAVKYPPWRPRRCHLRGREHVERARRSKPLDPDDRGASRCLQ